MIYVGIDIAKLNHFASAISSDGKELMKPFKFTNDGDGFQMLNSRLTDLSCEGSSIIIGLESTAHYGDNLVRYLVACNYNVCVLNPIKTSVMRKDNIRKSKTDKVDTYIIAKTLILQDSYRFVSFYPLLKETPSPQGIDYINGRMILDEIGDIHRFSCPTRLLEFADLALLFTSLIITVPDVPECPNAAPEHLKAAH